ncbi:MAG: hypothetical protein A2W91_10025 [Bacteroidetes bacterium GWF2_38_335]|nr:MAG: hypothetical protein A2W91_10025 [Bacteroidetes bacterium GWF2_38_335]HBS88037.1 hypothetical protein [Bacteroidales bacterium]
MKTFYYKLTAIIVIILFTMNGFAQTSDDEITKLKKDVKSLKSENNRLKLQLTTVNDSLNQSIENLTGVSAGTGEKVSSFEQKFNKAIQQNIKVHKATNARFERFRSIIKTSVILAAIGFFLLGSLIVIMYLMFRKKYSWARTELLLNNNAINELNARLNEVKTELSKGLNEMHEKIAIRLIDTNKQLDLQIAEVKKSYESSDSRIRSQFENEILVTKNLATEQLSEKTISLKDVLSKQIADTHETLSFKLDKLNKHTEEQVTAAISICEGADVKIKKQFEKDLSVVKEFTEEQFGILKSDVDKCLARMNDEVNEHFVAMEKMILEGKR